MKLLIEISFSPSLTFITRSSAFKSMTECAVYFQELLDRPWFQWTTEDSTYLIHSSRISMLRIGPMMEDDETQDPHH